MVACGTHDFCLSVTSRFYLRNFLFLFLGVFGSIQGSSQPDSAGFGKADKISTALKGEILLSPEGTSKLAQQSWGAGFPGVPDRFEWFGIVYRGNFGIKTPGVYQFHLPSDDGSKLFIDDSLIINNDGVHASNPVANEIKLGKSDHKIEVQYFQGPRMHLVLQLSYVLKGGQLKIFPGDDLIKSTIIMLIY